MISSVLFLCNKQRPSIFIAFIATIMMLISGNINYISLVIISLFIILIFKYKSKLKVKKIEDIHKWFFIVILTIVIMSFFHEIPYFYNWNIISKYSINGNKEFSLWLNFDKYIFIYILYLFFTNKTTPLPYNNQKIKNSQIILFFIITIFFLTILSLLLKMVEFDYKIDEILVIWAINNLLITCVAEELFFRGFFQNNLTKYLIKFKYKDSASILITSIFFGAMHLISWKFAIVAFFASIFYCLIFKITKDIRYSIFLHFIVNFIHFVFFSYPFLV